LNFEFRETPRREVLLYRGVELSEASLESYRDSVGHLFAWPMFTSFTEQREEAEEYGRAWRGGVPVLFELRSALCRRLRTGTYLLHPFAVLQVEAVTGNAVKLVEVELLEPGRIGPFPAQRPGVVPRFGDLDALCEAAKEGDVRAIAEWATGPELINAGDADGCTPLHVASCYGKTEAVKALVWLGADVNIGGIGGATPLSLASHQGHESTVRTLVSLGADVNIRDSAGTTPLAVASHQGHESTVRTLASLGANVETPNGNGATPIYFASQNGHESVVRVLTSAGADVNAPYKGGVTPICIASDNGHESIVRMLASVGADVNAACMNGATPIYIASQNGHTTIVRVLASVGEYVKAHCEKGVTQL
jgi:hypothetical protein